MKYVIDTSIEVKRFVPEADSPKALQLRDDARKGIHDLLAPDLFPIEVCNALMILERAGKILPGEANLLFARFLREVPNLHEAIPRLPRALEIAQQFRQSVYDCLYVALAERESCELVTADDKLVNAVKATLPFVIRLTDLP
jgi:predicted nucleic acid-binding protein